jgi:lipopolysaccharide biosynthesis glycosyltransferase
VTSIAFHIPISPTLAYFSRLKWLCKSIRSWSSRFSSIHFHLSISNEDSVTLSKLSRDYAEIINDRSCYHLHICDKVRFNRFHYIETGAARYLHIDNSDITIFCDADIIFLADIIELIDMILEKGGIYGVLAQGSPFFERTQNAWAQEQVHNNETWWHLLFEQFIGTSCKFGHSYLAQAKKCPLYYNAGFLIGKTKDWLAIKDYAYTIQEELIQVFIDLRRYGGRLPIGYTFQIAFTLALYKFNIRSHPISPAYNAWNTSEFLRISKVSLKDIKIIHYFVDHYINLYKTCSFEDMIEKARNHPSPNSINSLMVERADTLKAI